MNEATHSSKTSRPQVLKGFRDHLPKDMIKRRAVTDIVRRVFERHGFDAIDTPALEHLEVLRGKAGENETLMYHFRDQGDREVGLRYDLTVPLARFIAVHESELVFPVKRFHIAPVWRAEKPQRGRFREFWQCDADIVGSRSAVADAEVIAIVAESLAAIGLPNVEILVSHRTLLRAMALAAGVPEGAASTVFRAIDKIGKIGPMGVRVELTQTGIDGDAADRLIESVSVRGTPADVLNELAERVGSTDGGSAALGQLREVVELLPLFGVDGGSFAIDPSLARGLDYYTGIVFEAVVNEPKVGSLAAGGRYDDLVGAMIGRDLPTVGASLGLDRILEVIDQFDLMPTPATGAEVFVAAVDATLASAVGIAAELRSAGLNVDLTASPRRSLGEQLKYAGRRGIGLAVVIGPSEQASGQLTMKHLGSGEQLTVERDQIVAGVLGLRARSV